MVINFSRVEGLMKCGSCNLLGATQSCTSRVTESTKTHRIQWPNSGICRALSKDFLFWYEIDRNWIKVVPQFISKDCYDWKGLRVYSQRAYTVLKFTYRTRKRFSILIKVENAKCSQFQSSSFISFIQINLIEYIEKYIEFLKFYVFDNENKKT